MITMEYTVKRLSRLAGVSTRTLRYYDQIGLLKPARLNSAGYRIYGSNEVDRLQQILLYRELGMGLEQITEVLSRPSFDAVATLYQHQRELLTRRQQIDQLIHNVEKTIAMAEGRTSMTDVEKFEGFKRQMVEKNEKKYGEEIRAKYGDKEVEASNQKVLEMTPSQWAEIEKLNATFNDTLQKAMAGGDPGGDLAQKAADLHRQWLGFFWKSYSQEAHAGLAQMYVDDERFTAYYEKIQSGAAVFLRDAIWIYTGMNQRS